MEEQEHYGQERNQSSGKGSSTIWIIAFIVIAFLIWQNSGVDTTRTTESTIQDVKGAFSRGEIVDEEEVEEVEEEPVIPTIDENECGYADYGMADYAGTSDEGKNCEDFYDSDNECVANPPTNYDGYIDKSTGTSDPLLTCCEKDGTCQWA